MRYVIVHEVVAKMRLGLAPGSTKEAAEDRLESMRAEMVNSGVTVLSSRLEEVEDPADVRADAELRQ
jgi:hypothetical protein